MLLLRRPKATRGDGEYGIPDIPVWVCFAPISAHHTHGLEQSCANFLLLQTTPRQHQVHSGQLWRNNESRQGT